MIFMQKCREKRGSSINRCKILNPWLYRKTRSRTNGNGQYIETERGKLVERGGQAYLS